MSNSVLVRWAVLPLAAIIAGGFGCRSGVADDGFLVPPTAEEGTFYSFVPPDDLMLPPTKAWTYHDIAVAQANAGDVAGAIKTVSQIRDKSPIREQLKKAWTYRRIAVIQAEAGDFAGAMKTVSQIRINVEGVQGWPSSTTKIKASAYRDIAASQAAAGDISGAMKTVSQIRDKTVRE
jgi:hypothetical protein